MGTTVMEMTGAGAAGLRPMRMIGERDLAISIGRFTFSADYASGGETLTPGDIGLQEILYMVFTPVYSGGTATRGAGLDATWNPSTSKIVAIGATANAGTETRYEVAAHTNLSTYQVRFLAIGYK